MRYFNKLVIFIVISVAMIVPLKVRADEKVVAMIGDIEYYSLIDALEALEENQTLTLLENIDFEAVDEVYVKNLPDGSIVDLNSHDIKIGWVNNIGNLIFTGKNVTIKNGSFSGNPDYVLWIGDEAETDHFLIENLTLDGGVNIFNSTNVVLRDIRANGKTYYAVWGDENAHITIESGLYKSAGYATLGFTQTESDITITGGEFEVTNSLLLETSPIEKLTIKAGIFDSDVSKYLHEPYECIKEKESYVVRRKDVEKIEITVANQHVSNKIIAESLQEYGEIDVTNKTFETNIDIVQTAPEKMIVEKINNFIKKTLSEVKIAQYFDISVNVIDVNSKETIGILTKLNQEIEFEVSLPKEVYDVKNRKFYIIRTHDDKMEFLDVEVNPDERILTFKTDRFSTYTIAYVDEIEIINPDTSDGICNDIIMSVFSMIGMIIIAHYLKKEKYNC